jgi:hypothetical protein
MSYRWATPETDLQTFQEWPASKAGGLWLSFTPLDTPQCTPMLGRCEMEESYAQSTEVRALGKNWIHSRPRVCGQPAGSHPRPKGQDRLGIAINRGAIGNRQVLKGTLQHDAELTPSRPLCNTKTAERDRER